MYQVKKIYDCKLGEIGIINLPGGNEYVLVIESDNMKQNSGLVLSQSYFKKITTNVEILLVQNATIEIELDKNSVVFRDTTFVQGAIRLVGNRKLICFDTKEKLQQIDAETGVVEAYCTESLPLVRSWKVVVPGVHPAPSVLTTLSF